MNQDHKDELAEERALLQSLSALSSNEQAAPDLWPAISTKIQQQRTSGFVRPWYLQARAIAASWVISLLALAAGGWLMLNAHRQQDFAQTINGAEQEFVAKLDKAEQLKIYEKQYLLARSALMTQLLSNQGKLSAETKENIESNLLIIEQATDELNGLLQQQPDNQQIQHLLHQTWQKEIVFLQHINQLLGES